MSTYSYDTRVREGADDHGRVTLPRGTVLEPQTYWCGDDADWVRGVHGADYPTAVLGLSVLLQDTVGHMCEAGWATVDVVHGKASHGPHVRTTDSYRYIAHEVGTDVEHGYPGEREELLLRAEQINEESGCGWVAAWDQTRQEDEQGLIPTSAPSWTRDHITGELRRNRP